MFNAVALEAWISIDNCA